MRNPYDAIVLGAGVAGLSVARELAKLKQRVLVLEREPVGGETSRAAAGILDPYTEVENETPLLEIGLEAVNFYPSFLKEITRHSAKEVEFEKLGILYLAFNSRDEKILKNRFQWQRRHGLQTECISASEVFEMEPQVSGRTRIGVYYPEVSKLNANRLTDRLLRATRSAGAEVRSSIKDVSVTVEKGRIRGVKVSGKAIEAPAVVLAPGCWAGIDKRLGIKMKIYPVRGQIFILRSNPTFRPRHILHTTRWAYVVPWPNNRLLIGSTLESAGFVNRVTAEGKRDILNRVSEISEKIRQLPIERSWAGLRPQAKRGKPLIGPTPIKGLFLASGYYRSGILIGPFVGKLLAEGIVKKKFSSLLKPFFPEKRGLS